MQTEQMNEHEKLLNLRDFCTGLVMAMIDKEIITINEWNKYLMQAKQHCEQEDAKYRDETIANMSSGERLITEILKGN